MRRRAEKGTEKQAAGVLELIGERISQALLPMMAGVLSAKQDLLSFMQAMGHAAVVRVFEDEVAELVGPEGKHQRDRTRYRWGSVGAEFTLGGQRVTLKRGQALVLRFDADVGTDLRWEMQRYDGPNVIAPVRHDLTAKPGTNPAAVGGIGDATFRLRGIAPGTQPVLIEYRRAFEAAAAKTIRFEVVVL